MRDHPDLLGLGRPRGPDFLPGAPARPPEGDPFPPLPPLPPLPPAAGPPARPVGAWRVLLTAALVAA
ncbi:hypothetical protein, partial [Spongiactinospora sp. TRM90649]|uniref:hypothetical protein n=1 Tax=Spongiactinospora sp. TRM90649 TaxID=3031114 RepID=UPI0023F87CC7